VPRDLPVGTSTQDTILSPVDIKRSKVFLGHLKMFFNLNETLGPGDPSVFHHALLDEVDSLHVIPSFMIENDVVTHGPDNPEYDAFDESPDPFNQLEGLRSRIPEQGLLPIRDHHERNMRNAS
jgi:hypothetical protein